MVSWHQFRCHKCRLLWKRDVYIAESIARKSISKRITYSAITTTIMQHNVKRLVLSQEARKAKLEKDKVKTRHYRRLTKKLLDGKHHHDYSQQALSDTTELLQLNPEFNTMWNYRRNILLALFASGELTKAATLEGDLRMVMAQLKAYPKCYWIWNHRYWCLQQLQQDGIADWEFELKIVSKLLELDSRNFHGWHYRRYVVENMESNAVAKEDTREGKLTREVEIALGEFQYTTAKINKNISNFSAWHNRTKLVEKIFGLLRDLGTGSRQSITGNTELFEDPVVLFNHDIQLVKTGMYMDADDSSVWLYMQWLMTDKLFVEALEAQHEYEAALVKQIADIEELNELEKSDSPTGSGNVWCLKSLVLLKHRLLERGENADASGLSKAIKQHLDELVQTDPLRSGRYKDQLAGLGLHID